MGRRASWAALPQLFEDDADNSRNAFLLSFITDDANNDDANNDDGHYDDVENDDVENDEQRC